MNKESSLIAVSKSIKKFAVVIIIIAILALCWNTIKSNPNPISPINPVNDSYTYLKPQPLLAEFEPTNLKTKDGISLYSKQVLSKGEFPQMPQYVYVYQASKLVEDFGTFKYANTLAERLGFLEAERQFNPNIYEWKNPTSSFVFDRRDLSVLFTRNSASTKTDQPKIDTLEGYINNINLNLNGIMLSSPDIYKTEQGEIRSYFRELPYAAMTEESLEKFSQTNILPSKGKVYDSNSHKGQLLIHILPYTETDFDSDKILQLNYWPLNINSEAQQLGIYKIIDINQAFQDINTFKVEPESTSEQTIDAGNLYNFIAFSKSDYFTTIEPKEIKSVTVNSADTKIGYLYSETGNIGYLHPIYIFSGEGTTDSGIEYVFYIYVDALPKK